MIDLFDVFNLSVDMYQQGKLSEQDTLQADSDRRITNTGDRLRDLETRHERMRLVMAALWQLLKSHTGMTDSDLKKYIEQVDLSDGKRDGKLARATGAMDCPKCSRRILKSATICVWCGSTLTVGDAFHAT
jgi:hypothetical protein